MEPNHGHGHDYLATNRRNIERLRDDRDRAGLIQLADVLEGRRIHDACTLAAEARDAAAFIDSTAPRIFDVDDADGIRVGDILRYCRGGHTREGLVLSIDGYTVTTNHGDTVAI